DPFRGPVGAVRGQFEFVGPYPDDGERGGELLFVGTLGEGGEERADPRSSALTGIPFSSTSRTPSFHGDAASRSPTAGPSEANGTSAAAPSPTPAAAPAAPSNFRRVTPSTPSRSVSAASSSR